MIRPENQCEGKVRYETANAVHQAVAHVNSRGKVRVCSYKCSDCNYWHYGHAGRGKKMRPIKNKYRI